MSGTGLSRTRATIEFLFSPESRGSSIHKSSEKKKKLYKLCCVILSAYLGHGVFHPVAISFFQNLFGGEVSSCESERLQKKCGAPLSWNMSGTGLSRWMSGRCTGPGPGPTRLVDLSAIYRDEHQPIRVLFIGAMHWGGSAYLSTYLPT